MCRCCGIPSNPLRVFRFFSCYLTLAARHICFPHVRPSTVIQTRIMCSFVELNTKRRGKFVSPQHAVHETSFAMRTRNLVFPFACSRNCTATNATRCDWIWRAFISGLMAYGRLWRVAFALSAATEKSRAREKKAELEWIGTANAICFFRARARDALMHDQFRLMNW